MPPESDEFGNVYVFSDERMKALRDRANTEFTAMCETIKLSESALAGIVEFLRCAERNERSFHAASKRYVETLKAIAEEIEKVKF